MRNVTSAKLDLLLENGAKSRKMVNKEAKYALQIMSSAKKKWKKYISIINAQDYFFKTGSDLNCPKIRMK